MDSNEENWTVARDFIKIFFRVYVEQNKKKKDTLLISLKILESRKGHFSKLNELLLSKKHNEVKIIPFILVISLLK